MCLSCRLASAPLALSLREARTAESKLLTVCEALSAKWTAVEAGLCSDYHYEDCLQRCSLTRLAETVGSKRFSLRVALLIAETAATIAAASTIAAVASILTTNSTAIKIDIVQLHRLNTHMELAPTMAHNATRKSMIAKERIASSDTITRLTHHEDGDRVLCVQAAVRGDNRGRDAEANGLSDGERENVANRITNQTPSGGITWCSACLIKQHEMPCNSYIFECSQSWATNSCVSAQIMTSQHLLSTHKTLNECLWVK